MDTASTEMSTDTAALMASEVVESIAAKSKPDETSRPEEKSDKKGFFDRYREKKEQKKVEASTPKPGTSYDRSEFQPGADTGLEADGKKRGRSFKEKSSREVFISEEIQRQYGTFLRRHLMDLKRVSDKSVLSGPSHLYERALLKLFDDGKGGISESKADEFTKTSRGLIITTMIMDRRTELETMSLGIDLAAAWNQHLQETPTEGANTFNLGELAKEFRGASTWIRRHGGRFPDRLSSLAGAIEGGVLGGSAAAFGTWLVQNRGEGIANFLMNLTEVEVAGLIGGVGGAIIGGVLGRKFLSNNGDLDLIACGENLDVIRSLPPQEQKYIKAVTGIDFEDFTFTPRERRVIFGRTLPEIFNTRERIDFGRAPADIRTKSIFEIKDDIRQRLHTRQQFFEAIGLERPDTRTVPFNKLRPNFEYNPQTDVIWKRRINELYRAELTSRGVVAGGVESLGVHLEVQQTVLNEFVEQYLSDIGKTYDRDKGELFDVTEVASRITAKITKMETQKTESDNAVNKRVTALVGKDVGQVGRLTELDGKFKAASIIQSEIDKITAEARSTAVKIGIDVRGTSSISDIVSEYDVTIGRLKTQIGGLRGNLTTSRRAIRSSRTMTPHEIQVALSEIETRTNTSIDKLETKIKDYNTSLSDIYDKQQASAVKQKEFHDSRIGTINPDIGQFEQDFTFFTTPTPDGIGLTLGQLTTMSIGEVQTFINRANRRRASIGWGEAQNNNQSNMDRIINAIVEARTRTGADAPSHQEAIQFVIRDINREAQQLEESKDITNEELQKQAETVNKKLISGQGDLFARTISVFGDADSRAKLFDLTNITTDDVRYSTTEERRLNSGQTIRRPRAYYEWMELLFQYQEGESRGVDFLRAVSLLRPIDLARILMNNPRLRLVIAPTTPDDQLFFTVIRTIDHYSLGGLINETDIRSAVADIVISVQGRLDGMLG